MPNICYERNVFDLKEKIWKESSCLYQIFAENPRKPPQPLVFVDGFRKLFVCGSKIILIAMQLEMISYTDQDQQVEEETLFLFELDVEDGWVFELPRVPIEMRRLCVQKAVCHGDCIYMGDTFPFMVFNVKLKIGFGLSLKKTCPKLFTTLQLESLFGVILQKACTNRRYYYSIISPGGNGFP